MNSLLLDPSKSFISIQIWYVEEKDEKHGFNRFHFLDSREDLEHWKGKGYLTQEEFDKTSSDSQPSSQPGMPEKSSPDSEKIIKVIKTWWTRMTWKQTNEINAKCLTQNTQADGDVKINIDAIKYRDIKLKCCLKKWDLMDENNREIPVTDVVIDQLVPEMAQSLISSFERVTEPTEEQLKN